MGRISFSIVNGKTEEGIQQLGQDYRLVGAEDFAHHVYGLAPVRQIGSPGLFWTI
jgi:hypothetical protein